MKEVLISFREWLHSYRNVTGIVRAITIQFSSLSESGFIPTDGAQSHPGRSAVRFSSLSESGFIPTLGFHDCLSMRLLEREKGNLRNLVLV